jgi:arylsulfatase A
VYKNMMKLIVGFGSGLVLATSMVIAAACSAQQAPQSTESASPNIIYILADDLGVGDIGAYGQQKIKTPHLDALAAEGMVFDQHYAGSTVCAPSRAVLMTGRHTGQAVVRGNRGFGGFRAENELGQEPLPAGTLTIARMLKDAGYATGGFGKWGLGAIDSEGAPFRQGFDLFFGYYDQKIAHNYYPTHLWRNEERVPLNQEFIDVHPPAVRASEAASDYLDYLGTDYAPYRIIDEAETFIRENAGTPFFVYLPFIVPHAALQIPDREIERFGYSGAFPETPHVGSYTPHPTPRAARAAMISRMDADIGRIVALVEELGLSEDTVIMFASDNGPASAGGGDPAFFDSTAGLRGLKRDLYEGGIRSPLYRSLVGCGACRRPQRPRISVLGRACHRG